jgi:hypothetical protein
MPSEGFTLPHDSEEGMRRLQRVQDAIKKHELSTSSGNAASGVDLVTSVPDTLSLEGRASS